MRRAKKVAFVAIAALAIVLAVNALSHARGGGGSTGTTASMGTTASTDLGTTASGSGSAEPSTPTTPTTDTTLRTTGTSLLPPTGTTAQTTGRTTRAWRAARTHGYRYRLRDAGRGLAQRLLRLVGVGHGHHDVAWPATGDHGRRVHALDIDLGRRQPCGEGGQAAGAVLDGEQQRRLFPAPDLGVGSACLARPGSLTTMRSLPRPVDSAAQMAVMFTPASARVRATLARTPGRD